MARPRPPSPVRLIWLRATCPKMIPRMAVKQVTKARTEQMSEAMANPLVDEAAAWAG